MTRRLLAVLLSGVLVVGGLGAAPASAAHVEVPDDDDANILDQSGDANYHSTFTGSDAGPSLVAADIVKVWFTHDADTISTHIQTAGATQPPSSLLYRVFVDPGAGSNCLQIRGFTGAAGNPSGQASGSIRDTCDGDTVTAGEFLQEEGPPVLADGRPSGIHTIIMPRDAHPVFADGSVLRTPEAETRHFTVAVTAPVIDDTDIGTDYEVKEASGRLCGKIRDRQRRQRCLRQRERQQQEEGDGEEEEEEEEEENGDQTRKKQPGRCPAYQPGEMGAEVEEETTIVTDEATEEEPIEMEFDFGPAGGSWAPAPVDTTEHIFHNVQIDSEAEEVGFWAKLTTPPLEDPDLYVYWDNGTVAAQATGFNPLLVAGPVPFFDGTGNGGHSGFDYEQIDGIGTADCTGYTLDLVNWLGFGGTYTLTLWLGDIENEAKPRD